MTVFTVLPISLARNDLETVNLQDATDLSDYRFESTAYGQWNFNKSNSDVLKSIINNKTLTVATGSNTNIPIYNADHIDYTSGNSAYLQTDLPDSNGKSGYTISTVVRIPVQSMTSSLRAIFGQWTASATGSMMYFRNGKLDVAVTTGLVNHEIIDTVYEQWMFLALSVDNVNKKVICKVKIGAFEFEQEFSLTSRTYSNVNHILGNGVLGAANLLRAQYSEYVVFDKALSHLELGLLLGRTIKRSASKSIVI